MEEMGPFKFALLFPLTSRNSTRHTFLGDLKTTLTALAHTTDQSDCIDITFEVLLGVDRGDPLLDPETQDQGGIDIVRFFQESLPASRFTTRLALFQYPRGHVCKIWRDFAREALDRGGACRADFALLLGDDVRLETPSWPRVIISAFHLISVTQRTPFGFGCVAFLDEAFPGFPTFPVLHSTHIDIFPNFAPDAFINSDLDPFLFQIYRNFGCSTLEGKARLRNLIGGDVGPRYKKTHVSWRGRLLSDAVNAAEQWLQVKHDMEASRTLTIDVIVPTFRANREFLDRFLQLDSPPGVSLTKILILDNPRCARATKCFQELQHKYRADPTVRLRATESNQGASGARNRGLMEASGEFVLFLDDDVIPSPDIVAQYARAAQDHPDSFGFVGPTKFPKAACPMQRAVHQAGVTFFWDMAEKKEGSTNLPWAVTANVMLRRDPEDTLRFDTRFPRTGGGEDIDFCLKTAARFRGTAPCGLVAVPGAWAVHPWWEGGVPKVARFAGWARGDGMLIDLYPGLTYRNLPDLAETLLACAALTVLHSALLLLSKAYGWHPRSFPCSSWSLLLLLPLLAVSCALADVADEVLFGDRVPEEDNKGLTLLGHVGVCCMAVWVRTWSEGGRLRGHWERGRLLVNLGRRFNWFGDMWEGAVWVERRKALRRWGVRVLLGWLVVGWVPGTLVVQ